MVSTRSSTTPAIPPNLDSTVGASGLPGASVLRRVGPRLGIRTVRDLLFHLPRRYDDLREMSRLRDLRDLADGTPATARVQIVELRTEPTIRRRIQRTIAILQDASGEGEAVWFGRRYIERRLKPGDWVVMSGRVRQRGFNTTFEGPEFQRDDGSEILHAGRIVPVYRLTSGLTARTLRSAIRAALDRFGPYPDPLAEIARQEGLAPLGEAVEEAHYPSSFERRDRALERLAFDELVALQAGMVARRLQRDRGATRPIETSPPQRAMISDAIVRALSRRSGHQVTLTQDQTAACQAVFDDLARTRPMLRLLQGDVGSGKTAVAAAALAAVGQAGGQAALLAPTDLLARQHAATIAELLDGLGLPVTLLTGSLSAAGRRASLEAIHTGQAPIVVGTHALLQESVSFAALGLVVIDEQHRFGVAQRADLEAKADGAPPHVLLMTATPIPRTMGQVLYADLDVTDLRSRPADRLDVLTGIRDPDHLAGAWETVRREASQGRRTFVVVPLIDDPEDVGAAAAEAEAARLRELLAPLRIGLVHGRLKPAERDQEMARFRDGDLDVLVGTTVIEVGVDVPEATMMIILDADRFGLAQLHQLRGRVGRGRDQGYCVLVTSSTDPVARKRLETLVEIRDGFALAEADFALRREGDVLGLAQSGLPTLRVASLQRPDHRELAMRARRQAEDLIGPDGELDPRHAAFGRELAGGWLTRIAAGDPASGV